MLRIEEKKHTMSRCTIALGRKKKLGCFLGAIVFAMFLASCTDSEPLLSERSVTKPERRVTKPKDSSAMPEIFSPRPAWVNSCPKKKDFKVYGCGSGETKETSRKNAMDDLSDKIASIARTYESRNRCWEIYDSAKEKDKKINNFCKFYSEITTKKKFRNLKIEPYSDNNIHHTKVEWDTAHITKQAVGLLKKHNDPCIPSNQEKSIWEKTYFAMWVQEELGCRPKWELRESSDGEWIVDVASEEISVEFQSERENFIPYSKTQHLNLKLHRPDRYEEVEGYYLEVTNTKEGHLYLFKIDQNGQALKIPIVKYERKAHPARRFYPPDAPEEKGCTLGSEAPDDVKDDSFKEFFIAALCEKPTRTGDISTIIRPDQAYSIIPLFDKIKSCIISTASHTTRAIKVSSTSTCENYKNTKIADNN